MSLSLRDQLLKAGLVNQKQAQAAFQSQLQQTRGAGIRVEATAHHSGAVDATPQPHSSMVGPAAAVDDDQPDVEHDQLEVELEANSQQLHPEESEEEDWTSQWQPRLFGRKLKFTACRNLYYARQHGKF